MIRAVILHILFHFGGCLLFHFRIQRLISGGISDQFAATVKALLLQGRFLIIDLEDQAGFQVITQDENIFFVRRDQKLWRGT